MTLWETNPWKYSWTPLEKQHNMLLYLKDSLQTYKMRREGLLFFLFFMLIFSIVDHLNLPYTEMMHQYGLYLVITNILLNLIMSFGASFLALLSQFMIEIKALEPKGTKLGFFSVIFALLTYGCTSCVIALFANIGITYAVIALPLAGLPYKFLNLFIIAIGVGWSLYDINKGSCKVKFN